MAGGIIDIHAQVKCTPLNLMTVLDTRTGVPRLDLASGIAEPAHICCTQSCRAQYLHGGPHCRYVPIKAQLALVKMW